MKTLISSTLFLFCSLIYAQKEIPLYSNPSKATVFFEGAQLFQEGKITVSTGRQLVVFKNLTDELDGQSVRVKGKGDFTILSVKTRKNFEDQVNQNEELEALNKKKENIEKQINALTDEQKVYAFDESVLRSNYNLKSEQQGVKIEELKEASLFFHTKMNEIKTQQRRIADELDQLLLQFSKIQQEIRARRSKPIINYSEVVVEIEAKSAGQAYFELNYITNAASWSPYYDMRSAGVNQTIQLEAKGKVRQNTGIDWKNLQLTLSTSNPYENAQEPNLKPLYLFYNNYYYPENNNLKRDIVKDYSGQAIKGRVIDYETGEALPFCNVTILGTNKVTQTDFDGRFSIMVPQGYNTISVSYVGFQTYQSLIDGPYLKLFLTRPNLKYKTLANKDANAELEQTTISGTRVDDKAYYYIDGIKVRGNDEKDGMYFNDVQNINDDEIRYAEPIKRDEKKIAYGYTQKERKLEEANFAQTSTLKKDLRVEYHIQEQFSIPSDGAEYGVNIANYTLEARYEYHAVPKIDPSVYLVAQVFGWEKHNLLDAPANLYFDGTFIGTSTVEASTTKDTLNFSLGKENGITIERKKIDDLSKEKLLGTRKKVDVGYQIDVRNNTGSNIPLFIKDQFPISQDGDIKVKQGSYANASLDSKTGILTWKLQLNKGEKSTQQFDYSIDFDNNRYLRIE
jgi:hypothetical protein